jgi:hypothetical protein
MRGRDEQQDGGEHEEEVGTENGRRKTGDRLQTHSCREWLEGWVKGKQGATAAKTMLKYSQVARDFLK